VEEAEKEWKGRLGEAEGVRRGPEAARGGWPPRASRPILMKKGKRTGHQNMKMEKIKILNNKFSDNNILLYQSVKHKKYSVLFKSRLSVSWLITGRRCFEFMTVI
jgi:hypothetical protein